MARVVDGTGQKAAIRCGRVVDGSKRAVSINKALITKIGTFIKSSQIPQIINSSKICRLTFGHHKCCKNPVFVKKPSGNIQPDVNVIACNFSGVVDAHRSDVLPAGNIQHPKAGGVIEKSLGSGAAGCCAHDPSNIVDSQRVSDLPGNIDIAVTTAGGERTAGIQKAMLAVGGIIEADNLSKIVKTPGASWARAPGNNEAGRLRTVVEGA
jgi:hypothetical protein